MSRKGVEGFYSNQMSQLVRNGITCGERWRKEGGMWNGFGTQSTECQKNKDIQIIDIRREKDSVEGVTTVVVGGWYGLEGDCPESGAG